MIERLRRLWSRLTAPAVSCEGGCGRVGRFATTDSIRICDRCLALLNDRLTKTDDAA